jgi:hypothetical protein
MDVFSKKSDSLGILPLAIRVTPRVAEEVVVVTLFAPESLLVSSSASGLAAVGSRAGPSAMERRVGAVQQG